MYVRARDRSDVEIHISADSNTFANASARRSADANTHENTSY